MKAYFNMTLVGTLMYVILAINYVQAIPLDATVEFNGHRYFLAPQVEKTWDEARAISDSETVVLDDGTVLKGHLVTINSQAEQDFIADTFDNVPFRHLWLGGYQFSRDAEPDGNWAWITGEEIGNITTDWSYQFLHFPQPGNDPNPLFPATDPNPVNREDALQMLHFYGDRWHDFHRGDIEHGSGVNRFVIEFDKIGDHFISDTELPNIVSSGVWRTNNTFIDGWQTVDFDDGGWLLARAPYPSPTLPAALIPGTGAEHMWYDPAGTSDGTSGSIRAFFSFDFNVDQAPDSRPLIGKAKISVDDDYDLYVNGNLVFQNHDGGYADVVDSVDFSQSLQNGKNVIAIEAVDGGWNDPRDRLYERVLFDATVLRLADLLVISRPSNATGEAGDIQRFDGETGGYIGEFADGCNPVDLAYGPDNRLYVADSDHPQFSGCDPAYVVGRFDGRTGIFEEIDDPHANYIPLFQDGRFQFGPGGLAFGPDDNLYISDLAANSVHRYQGPFGVAPGEFIDTFVVTGSGGLNAPAKLLFGPDNNLYVISEQGDSILRYQGPLGADPGAFMDSFVAPGSGGLDVPSDLAFGRDGRLYVASYGTSQILRYQGPSENSPGAFMGAFVNLGFSPVALAFGSDQDLYVSGTQIAPGGFKGVQRYDGDTGAFKSQFVSVDRPSQMIFSAIPDYIAPLLGDYNNDGCVDRVDLTDEMLPAIRSGSTDLKYDLNNDGMVNIADARKLVLLFSNPGGAACSLSLEIKPTVGFTSRLIFWQNVIGGSGDLGSLSVQKGTEDRVLLEFDISDASVRSEPVFLNFYMRNIDRPNFSTLSLYAYEADGIVQANDFYKTETYITSFTDEGKNPEYFDLQTCQDTGWPIGCEYNPFSLDVTDIFNQFINQGKQYIGFLLLANTTEARYDLNKGGATSQLAQAISLSDKTLESLSVP